MDTVTTPIAPPAAPALNSALPQRSGPPAHSSVDISAAMQVVAEATLPALILTPPYIARGNDVLLLLAELPGISDLFLETGELPGRAFVDSVKLNGVMQPIMVEPVHGCAPGEPAYRIIEGRRRVYAAILAGQQDVPAKVFPPGELNAEVVSLMMNEQRSANPLSDYINICRLEKTYSAIGYAPDEVTKAISRATGMPRGTIKSRLNIKNLIPSLHAALLGERRGEGHQGADITIPVQVADEAAKLPINLQAELNTLLEDKGRLKVSDVRDIKRTAGAQAVGMLPGSMFGDEDEDGAGGNVGANGGNPACPVAPAIVYRADPEATRLLTALLARMVRNMKKNGVDPASVTETAEAQAYLDSQEGQAALDSQGNAAGEKGSE